MKNSIVHFDIPVDDINRAKDFYIDTFGWKIEKFDIPSGDSTDHNEYYVVTTTDVGEDSMPIVPGAINGGLMKRQNYNQFITNYINVDSIDFMLDEIVDNGGEVIMLKTEIGKDMGWIALFRDTENNVMGLYEFHPRR